MLMTSKVVHVALKFLSFKSSKIMEQPRKTWKLELSSMELSILQVALHKFKDDYTGELFKNALISTEEELYSYKLISEIKDGQL